MRPFTAVPLIEDEEIGGCDWLDCDAQLKRNSPSPHNKVPHWTKPVIDFAK